MEDGFVAFDAQGDHFRVEKVVIGSLGALDQCSTDHIDGDLLAELRVFPGFPPHDGTDTRGMEGDDPVGDTVRLSPDRFPLLLEDLAGSGENALYGCREFRAAFLGSRIDLPDELSSFPDQLSSASSIGVRGGMIQSIKAAEVSEGDIDLELFDDLLIAQAQFPLGDLQAEHHAEGVTVPSSL